MENCEVMTSSPHSFAYSYRLVKKCFLKICETSKCNNILIFQPIFIRFSLLCLKFFTLSSDIELNLLWSSSLRQEFNVIPLFLFSAILSLSLHSIHICFNSEAFCCITIQCHIFRIQIFSRFWTWWQNS